MTGIIEKLGRAGASFFITLLTVLFTQLIRVPLYLSTDVGLENAYKGASFLSSLVAPLVLTPIFSWYIVGVFFKIKKLESQLREQAIRDPLTGLYNRRYLADALKRELTRVKREGQSMSLIIADIDYFKKVNDTYGHEAGDQCLMAVAQLFAISCRGSDIACRYGGEEFLLVLPNTSNQTALQRAEEIREKCADLNVVYNDKTIRFTISLGVSAYPVDGEEHEEIIIKADNALYQSKQNGRNRVTAWGEMREKK
jgi:diguanylate cyclase (GGDEF)-like protein